MKFAAPQYEVRHHGKNEWERISETEVLEEIQEAFSLVTPAIQNMILGWQFLTADAAYRINGADKSCIGEPQTQLK